MVVITAPDSRPVQKDDIKIFLAGSITGTRDWQSEVLNELEACRLDDRVKIFNPRRKDFNPDATLKEVVEQIEWEFNWLNNMDIFTMYFAASETSTSPICMYELGRHLEKMQHRFPRDWRHRILINAEDGYSRVNDVAIQTALAIGPGYALYDTHPKEYAHMIAKMARTCRMRRQIQSREMGRSFG